MVWGMMIAWYLFLAGVSAGAYLTATYVSKKYPFADTIRKTGYLLAAPLLAIGLLLLVFDAEAGLMHPFRFIHLLRNFPTSMMTDGTYIISVFLVVTGYQGVMVYLKKTVNRWVTRLGVIFAVGTMAYTGLLIGLVKAVPLWNTSILPVLFTVSAMSTGIAATVLVATFFNRQACFNLLPLKKIHASLITLELLLLFIMLYVTSNANDVAYQSVMSLLGGEYAGWFWGGLVGIGLIIPLLIEGTEIYQYRLASKPKYVEISAASANPSLLPALLTEGFVLIGGFILRYLVLAAAVTITLL
ncbi:NrfD/PsrC family molybdoenzyme membrane anchor subunit [Tepidibacillus marianensis]|uniref:NrfD/PsrC family molybdoenzyme membrane anchor subunit n=1 Tax=Tepidibacillus marianensis TaxID=3131995 RepID=UPI0030CD3CEF